MRTLGFGQELFENANSLINVSEEVIQNDEADVRNVKGFTDVYIFSVIVKRASLLLENFRDHLELFYEQRYMVMYSHVGAVADQ